jgi:hypothetical protein
MSKRHRPGPRTPNEVEHLASAFFAGVAAAQANAPVGTLEHVELSLETRRLLDEWAMAADACVDALVKMQENFRSPHHEGERN